MNATEKLLRFGVYELNLETEELRKDGTLLKLPPQPSKLLVLLASHGGHIVTRDDIQKQLWGDETFVDFDQGVNKCIKQIRAILNDNADKPSYVETLPRRGYRFVAPVTPPESPAPKIPAVHDATAPTLALDPKGSGPAQESTASRDTTSVPKPVPASIATTTTFAPDVPAPELALAQKSRRLMLSGILLAAIIVSLAIALRYYWRSTKVHALSEKDAIVLADFTNTTGDTVFDDTLKTALTVALNQSPFLNVLPDSKVAKTLKLMTRPAETKLSPDVAREVCQRTGSKAMVTGSIAGLGSQYVISLNAVDCNSGDVLAQTQEQADGKEKVLQALQSATVNLRSQVGESLSSVQKYDTPLQEATTPSLEALKAYSLGQKMGAMKGNTIALSFYKQAVELDPNFAMAYEALAVAYRNLGELGRTAENARRAYTLRGKVSERERFSIEAFYYTSTTGELEKAALVCEQWQQSYPRDAEPYRKLGYIYASLGNREKALKEDREALRLEPNQQTNYLNLGDDYAALNRLDEAEAVYKEAEERKLEGESLLGNRYDLAFLKGDAVQMGQLVSAALGKLGTEDVLLISQAETEAWYGKLSNARESTRRAMEAAEHNDANETAAECQAFAALWEVESGNRELARAEANAALKLAPHRGVQSMAALVLARAGDTAGAEKLAVELDRSFPLGTLVQRYWLPTIHAAVALQRKDPDRAIELLKVTTATELGGDGYLLPVYLRGEAYLMLRDGNAAAGEFQKFIEHYGLVANFTWGALARLGVARAYALDAATNPAARGKARAAYQDFLNLWKDADPDIPIYKQAKAEYAKLQ